MVKIILDICDPEQLFLDLADCMEPGVMINFDWLNRTDNGWPKLTIIGPRELVEQLFEEIYGPDAEPFETYIA